MPEEEVKADVTITLKRDLDKFIVGLGLEGYGLKASKWDKCR